MTSHYEQCQNTLLTLLHLHNSYRIAPGRYIREFLKTYKCDNYSDFSEDRLDIYKNMEEDTLKRVLDYSMTDEDHEKTEQVISRYFYYHQKRLLYSLSWKNRFYYMFDKYQQPIIGVGLFAFCYHLLKRK